MPGQRVGARGARLTGWPPPRRGLGERPAVLQPLTRPEPQFAGFEHLPSVLSWRVRCVVVGRASLERDTALQGCWKSSCSQSRKAYGHRWALLEHRVASNTKDPRRIAEEDAHETSRAERGDFDRDRDDAERR